MNCITCGSELTKPYYRVKNKYHEVGYVQVCNECIGRVKTPKKLITKVGEDE